MVFSIYHIFKGVFPILECECTDDTYGSYYDIVHRQCLSPPHTEKQNEAEDTQDLREREREMALQWMMLGGATAAEAVLALLLTVRYPAALRRRLLVIVSSLLQPALGIVPFAAFQLLGTNMPP